MIVVIPSLGPDRRLLDLVCDIRRELPDTQILVVDDGSGPGYCPIFQEARDDGARVIGYSRDCEKGYALRTTFRWCLENAPGQEVVCADSDGQHRPANIAAVARGARSDPQALVLEARAFADDTPTRSRSGNVMSAQFFRLASGAKVSDTQTGFRGYEPDRLKDLLDVPGDRFGWELNALLAAADVKRRIVQTPIETVYIDTNSGSHFHLLRDSWRVFRPLLAFAGAGVFCWTLELALFLALAGHFNLLAAVVGSRLTSGVVDFALNKLGVFRDHSADRTWNRVRQHTLLAFVLMAVTYAGAEALGLLHVPLWLTKIATDVLGFAVSFAVQRRFVFRTHPHGRALKEGSGRARQSTATAASQSGASAMSETSSR